jgi:predicted RNA-binding Zn ribbon-like protein
VRGTLRETVGEKLSKAAEENDAAAAEVFHDALLLRATIRNFADAAMKLADISEPLDALNRCLHSLPAQPPISIDRDGGRGLFTLEGQHLAEPLWPVVWSFTALITAGDASRIRQCEGEGCGYIYLDTTLNKSRRYCSSSGCGNRARARRHYHRVQAGEVAPGSSED